MDVTDIQPASTSPGARLRALVLPCGARGHRHPVADVHGLLRSPAAGSSRRSPASRDRRGARRKAHSFPSWSAARHAARAATCPTLSGRSPADRLTRSATAAGRSTPISSFASSNATSARPAGASAPRPRSARRAWSRTAVAPPPNRSWIGIAWPAAVILGLLGLSRPRVWCRVGESTGVRGPAVVDGRRRRRTGAIRLRPRARAGPGSREYSGETPASAEVRAGGARYQAAWRARDDVNRERAADGPSLRTHHQRRHTVTASSSRLIRFALIADGQAVLQRRRRSLAVPMQSAIEDWVVFPAPPEAGAVALQVGDFQRQTAKIPIDLRTRGTGVSEKPSPTLAFPVDLAATRRSGSVPWCSTWTARDWSTSAMPCRRCNPRVAAVVQAEDRERRIADTAPLSVAIFPVAGRRRAAGAHDGSGRGAAVPGQSRRRRGVRDARNRDDAILQIGTLTAETAKVPIDLSAAH